MKSKSDEVKHLADIVGEWGTWQFQIAFFRFISELCAAFINMAYAFHAKRVDFLCSDAPEHTLFTNISKESQCMKYMNPNESCTEWRYNTNQFRKSIVTEFDLVCDRAYYASLSQSSFQFGYVISGLIVTHLCDKYGRRPLIWFCIAIDIIAIIACGLSVNITQYIICRLISGIGHSGFNKAISTILIEACGPKHRADIIILANTGWVLGYALVPLLAYYVPDFRYMLFLSSIPYIIMLVWFYFLCESPRWQIATGQLDKAKTNIRKALKMNGLSDDKLKTQMTQLAASVQNTQNANNENKSTNILDLVKTPNLRKYTLILFYEAATHSLMYYGFSFNMDLFGGNFYITFALSGLVELPTQLLTPIFLRFVGRRKLFFIFKIILSVSCLAVIPFQSGWTKVVFALIAKYAITSEGAVMNIQASEIYPTVIRATGMGALLVFGRFGSMSSPFMKELSAITSLTFVMLFCGALSAIGAFLGLLLPETKDRELPDTIDEAENIESIELKVIGSN